MKKDITKLFIMPKILRDTKQKKSISKKINPANTEIPPSVIATGYPKRINIMTIINKSSAIPSIKIS